LLAKQSTEKADAPAIIYHDQQISFAELNDLSCRLASAMAATGITTGDRVAFWLPNTVAYVALYLACCRLGAIALAVNTRYRSVEVADIVKRSGAKSLIMWPDFRNIDFCGILKEIDVDALVGLEHIIIYGEGEYDLSLPDNLDNVEVHDYQQMAAAPAMLGDFSAPELGCNIFTTSGTTKVPKFVLHSQAGITDHGRDVVASMVSTLAGGGALLQALPFCGVFGFTQAIAALTGGYKMVVMNAFDPVAAVDVIDRYDVRYLNVTDDMVEALLAADPRDHALPTVRFCGYGSFNTDPEEIIDKAEARGLKLVGLYGMSEVQALFSRQPEGLAKEDRMLGGGKLLSPQAKVRVRDPDSDELLPFGAQGEIELAGPSLMGPSLMLGYFENPAANAETFTDDGFIRTGDMGYQVAEDRFVFLARMGDVLRLGGFLVSPVEIETHIQGVAGVSGCQVVGANIGGKSRAVAFVTTDANGKFDEQTIRDHCLAGLAKFKSPVGIYELEEFPTTASANGTKIQRAKLRQWAREWTQEAGD
jgi:fatty-acyl-CoA synthase